MDRKNKYNITQIILHREKLQNKDLEKSVDISRKIFLKCDENGELEENEKVRYLFYMMSLRQWKLNWTRMMS